MLKARCIQCGARRDTLSLSYIINRDGTVVHFCSRTCRNAYINNPKLDARLRVVWYAFRMMEARNLRQYRKRLKGYSPEHVSVHKPRRQRLRVSEVPVRSIPEDKIKCYMKEARAMLTGRKIGINKCTLLPGDPGYEEQVKED